MKKNYTITYLYFNFCRSNIGHRGQKINKSYFFPFTPDESHKIYAQNSFLIKNKIKENFYKKKLCAYSKKGKN